MLLCSNDLQYNLYAKISGFEKAGIGWNYVFASIFVWFSIVLCFIGTTMEIFFEKIILIFDRSIIMDNFTMVLLKVLSIAGSGSSWAIVIHKFISRMKIYLIPSLQPTWILCKYVYFSLSKREIKNILKRRGGGKNPQNIVKCTYEAPPPHPPPPKKKKTHTQKQQQTNNKLERKGK